MEIIIVIGALVLALVGLLLTPITICLNTTLGKYEVRIAGLLKTWMCIDNGDLRIHFRILGYHHRIRPKFILSRKGKKEGKKKRDRKTSKVKLKNILNVARSFRIKTFETSIDTDDYVLNARLIPVSWLLTLIGLKASVNFQGISYLKLEVKNNLWRLATAFLNMKKY